MASQTRFRSERVILLALAILPAVWLWLFDTSSWFGYLEPANPWVIPILAHLGLAHKTLPDYAFVALAILLMCFSLVYVVYIFKLKKTSP
jgi:hypothetical protein